MKNVAEHVLFAFLPFGGAGKHRPQKQMLLKTFFTNSYGSCWFNKFQKFRVNVFVTYIGKDLHT